MWPGHACCGQVSLSVAHGDDDNDCCRVNPESNV